MPSPLQTLRARNAASANPVTPGQAAGGLVALVGTITAGLLYASIPKDEGIRYVGYLDIVGIPTKCMGDTRNVVVGKRYTDEQCRESMEEQLVAHAKPVMECTPGLRAAGREYQRAAAVSLAYNIGPAAFCRSSAHRLFNAGKIREACDAFLRWNNAGGKVIRGLVLRRQRERALCLTGVA